MEPRAVVSENLTSRAVTAQPRAEKIFMRRAPTREEIHRLAHAIYIERGGGPGRELDDWLQAERELKAEVLLAEASVFLLQA